LPYVVERYWPGVTVDKLQRSLDDAWPDGALSVEEPVRYLGSLLFPSDEVVFYLFDGPSSEAVEEVSRHARLHFERVLECVWKDPPKELQTEANASRDDGAPKPSVNHERGEQ
jgi:hypothetical protein